MPPGTAKPKDTPASPYPASSGQLHQIGDWLWIPLRSGWRNVAAQPEEIVRQRFIRHLIDHYGYSLDQMDQERHVMHGHRSPRTDIAIWQTPEAMARNRSPALIIECKAENVEITLSDYYQGESYTRAVGGEFLIAHNSRFTAVFRLIPGLPGESVQISEIPAANDWADPRRIEEIKSRLRTFNRKEFQDLLFRCHSILRDVHKMDPGRAFDTISKILFIKMYIERSGNHGTFSVDFLDRRASTRLPTDLPVHDGLFEQTKTYYKADDLFAESDRLDISEETFRRIVKELERFDLSNTGDDIKGIAFERFLGTTFRGELGQFFTPRPIVDFMVSLLDPTENDLICDPAAGSGGFLIRAFEHVRAQITESVQQQKNRARARIEAQKLPPAENDQQIEAAFVALNRELLPSDEHNRPAETRLGRLAWNCIFGCDAEPRAARTAKMNMIMHGDGHGGIHHHDGLVDINGIFPTRFDVVITNPPFGANVGADQKVGASAETRVPDDPAYQERSRRRYGAPWEHSHQQMRTAANARKKILDLFEIGVGKPNRPTEIVFVERCLQLLKPGGRLGIVLPDGNLNNPSLAWLRRWCEGKAQILAVVSLPEETFRSADATVKASLVFLRRFTEADETAWNTAWAQAHATVDSAFDTQRHNLCTAYGPRIIAGDSKKVAALLANLATLGINRLPPTWTAANPPPYPRGIGPTHLTRPSWDGTPTDKKQSSALKKQLTAAFTDSVTVAAKTLAGELKDALRALDESHNLALWGHVRTAFDYPVFMAAPQTVGITSTGETGDTVPNQLPDLLAAYRQFQRWVEAGANPENQPDFRLPFAA